MRNFILGLVCLVTLAYGQTVLTPTTVATGTSGAMLGQAVCYVGDVLAYSSPGTNRVYAGSQVLTGTGRYGWTLASGDFDGDGAADLAVGNWPADNTVRNCDVYYGPLFTRRHTFWGGQSIAAATRVLAIGSAENGSVVVYTSETASQTFYAPQGVKAYGSAVAISADCQTIAVGCGGAVVLVTLATGKQAAIQGPPGALGFGLSVAALPGQGFAIGAFQEGSQQTGGVYLLDAQGAITGHSLGTLPDGWLGFALDVSPDWLAAGAPGPGNNGHRGSGAAWFGRANSDTWNAVLWSSQMFAETGTSVAVQGNKAIVGSPGYDTYGGAKPTLWMNAGRVSQVTLP